MQDPVQSLDKRTSALIRKYDVLEQLHRALDQGRTELETAIGSPLCVEDCGKCCEVGTPVVLDTEIHYIMSTVAFTQGLREKLAQRSLDWLSFQHPGIICYGKVKGQPETIEAKRLITRDAVVLAQKQCPYLEGTRCLIYNSRPLACRRYGVTVSPHDWCKRKLHWTESTSRHMIIDRDTPLGMKIAALCNKLCSSGNGVTANYMAFLPTAIARELDPKRLQQIVEENLVADAKFIIGKPQMDLFHRGE